MLPRWIKDYAVVAVVAAVVIGWFASRPVPTTPSFEGAAPQVLLEQTDGQTFDLAAHHGQPVLLVFWAEWCGSCKSQVDDLNRLHAERPDLPMLGIAMDSGSNKTVARHASKHGIEFPVAAADAATVAQYGVHALPTNVFIDAQGTVSDAVVGALDYPAFVSRLP